MALTERYKGRPAPVAAYDYQELTLGVGYRRFYGTSNALLTSPIDCIPNHTTKGGLSDGAWAMRGELDLDVTMAIPAVIAAGTAFVNFTYEIVESSTQVKFICKVRHDDGAETDLGSGTTATNDTGGAEDHFFFRAYTPITITRKKFGKGDVLRLTIECWVWTDGFARDIDIYHDPNSGETVTEEGTGLTRNTDLIFQIPFEVRA